jgi:hypothetical protein
LKASHSKETHLAGQQRRQREQELLGQLRESRHDYCAASAEYSAILRAHSPTRDRVQGTSALARAAIAMEKHARAWRDYAEMVRVATEEP